MDIQVSNGLDHEQINRGNDATLLRLGIAAQSDRDIHVLHELYRGSSTVFFDSTVYTVKKRPRSLILCLVYVLYMYADSMAVEFSPPSCARDNESKSNT